jgi:hypothetical protein
MMRRREEAAARFSDAILKRLIGRRLIEVKEEVRARAALQRVILDNLQTEEQLDAEARQILQAHARDIRERGLDYRQLFTKTKEKLARDRGFVL